MDKKTIIVIVALGAVILFYWPLLTYLGLVEPPAEPAPATQQAVETPVAPIGGVGITTPTDQNQANFQAGEIDTLVELAVEPTATDTIIVRTEKYEIILSTFGGGPLSIKLNEYAYRDGQPIEMLPEATKATPEASFAAGSFGSSSVNYVCNLRAGSYNVTGEQLEVVYSYSPPSGGTLERKYIFYPDRHNFDLTIKVDDPAKFGFERAYHLTWNTALAPTEPDVEADYQAMQAAAMMAGARESLDDFDDGILHETLEGSVTWAGVRSKYFGAVLIPLSRDAEAVFADGLEDDLVTPDGMIETRRVVAGLEMPFTAISPITDSFTVFVGPLDYGMMSDYGVGLQDMLDIGTTPYIGWIIKPFAIGIMWILPKLYNVIPNYGIVIILFALFVKVVTLPLSMKSFKSMQAMKTLQPKIDELKTRHKKDAQKLNKEMMKMYKEHGVNPLSGCLPMLPQMPLFFALFSVFRATILLRDAPFFWFIDDLSRGASGLTDPYMILVVMMIGAQFVSQKMTMPSNQQNKMLGYMMPLFMGFIFYKFAAGLVLYWTAFSILALLDYALFKRKKNPQVKAA